VKCAYCRSEVVQDANVCPVCRRDLYLLRPLLERIALLEQELKSLKEVSPSASQLKAPQSQLECVPPERSKWAHVGNHLIGLFVTPLLLLLLAHWLLSIVYDVNPLVLRLVCLVLPLPFGYLAYRWNLRPMRIGALAAAVMGLVAVFGMSWITSLIDMSPVLPASRVEVREFVEFACGIAFSGITGLLLGRHALLAGVRSSGRVGIVISALLNGKLNPKAIEDLVRQANALTGGLTTLGTSVVSVYAGFKSLM